jgi:hypothetical protein
VKHFGRLIAAAVFAGAGLPSLVRAADPRYPDWPCVQAKVPELSVAAVWDGPPIEQAQLTLQADPQSRDLVMRLAARRTPLEEAEQAIADFVSGDVSVRAEKGTRLFAGLFELLNSQRSEIMTGLERLARRQKELAEQIRSDSALLYELQDRSPQDRTRIEELSTRVEWNTRIFESRRQSIRYACEAPLVIEKRLFALSRAIQQAMEP